MSRFGTDFAVGMALLKGHFGEKIEYKNQSGSETTITNALWAEDDAGEEDDDYGRASARTVRVTIDIADLASVDRRGTIKLDSTSEVWVITSVASGHGVHRIDVMRKDRDDHTAGQVRA